jgi:hypothetical protein
MSGLIFGIYSSLYDSYKQIEICNLSNLTAKRRQIWFSWRPYMTHNNSPYLFPKTINGHTNLHILTYNEKRNSLIRYKNSKDNASVVLVTNTLISNSTVHTHTHKPSLSESRKTSNHHRDTKQLGCTLMLIKKHSPIITFRSENKEQPQSPSNVSTHTK